jgi:hypothetical protein
VVFLFLSPLSVSHGLSTAATTPPRLCHSPLTHTAPTHPPSPFSPMPAQSSSPSPSQPRVQANASSARISRPRHPLHPTRHSIHLARHTRHYRLTRCILYRVVRPPLPAHPLALPRPRRIRASRSHSPRRTHNRAKLRGSMGRPPKTMVMHRSHQRRPPHQSTVPFSSPSHPNTHTGLPTHASRAHPCSRPPLHSLLPHSRRRPTLAPHRQAYLRLVGSRRSPPRTASGLGNS